MPARYVRFVVQTWRGHVCMRVDVLGCRDEAHEICSSPLGMESGNILDDSITASSVHEHCPIPHSRLNSVISWCALANDVNEWLQIDLGLAIVSGVITQGRGDLNQWVTSYKLQFSTGGASGNWTTYQESDGVDKVFPGNVDNTTPVRHLLQSPVTTRYVRLVLVTWHGHISMRVEVLGCYDVAFGPQGSAFLPEDCQDIHLADPDLPSGPYTVFPWGAPSGLLVYCDMDTDGGGWTVFQRRQDGSVDFYLYWDDYRAGFPSQRVSGEFWLGNDNIHLLTSQKDYVLRVDLKAVDGATAYAVYDSFTVADESDKYRLAVGRYSGTAGDAMAWHNGMRFSTRDSDSDTSALNCAVTYTGAWWYNGCHHANLNGMYGNNDFGKGVNWIQFKGEYESLAFSEMKIRPKA
ncbi:PREDICTED: ryncolin-1-like [Branchiostoma belcheri]|uniref:Ryncolin-1-like n=1 Tax=Branchiostoma belcheri TaxID=7741 RepID=A0A6P5AJ42_BRABE|nr:PREDICTED: ryncolin-1-like [Branchiostoma belcheri]